MNTAYAQKEYVDFKTRSVAPLRKFEYHQPSNFEIVNGKLNAAIGSANGYLLEINGISSKKIKCKTKLNGKQFKVVLIDSRLDKTFTSTNSYQGTLRINCLPNGDLELMYSGEIYRNKQKVVVTATLVGKINHSVNLKTNN
ncbi:MAG: hypothetical protein Q8M15_01445 [Bacteroidota bacterium]|nr:hypothetical protein [Bacteroidota bacterium]